MEDRVKELEGMIKKLQEEKNKKPKFNKWIVTLMVLMVVCYTVAHLYIFLTIGSEPETLAKLFFSFVTIELALVAGLRVVDVRNKKKESEEYGQHDS